MKFTETSKSCGGALKAHFAEMKDIKDKGSLIEWVKNIFEKYETPEKYSQEVLDNLSHKNLIQGWNYIGSIILAGEGERRIK